LGAAKPGGEELLLPFVGASIGADLPNADLTEAVLSQADLADADLRGADLHQADLADADLHGADLRDIELHGANWSEADLNEADLRISRPYFPARATTWPMSGGPCWASTSSSSKNASNPGGEIIT
jgi:hypothetical protein